MMLGVVNKIEIMASNTLEREVILLPHRVDSVSMHYILECKEINCSRVKYV